MIDTLTFYTHPRSRSAIVHWMLEEIGVPYRIEVKEFGTTMKSPDFLAINPMGKVPALRHGGTVVTESAAICAYLADAFPLADLAPPPQDRGEYYRWLFFAAACVEPAIMNRSAGWDPGTLELWGRFGYGCYAQTVEVLAKAVANRRYIAGPTFSAADVYVGSMLGWAMQFDEIDKRPEFEAYWNGLKERPARKRALAQIERLAMERADA
ncbi:glutathione S-transferase family protein [Telmatospirillum siberiense]|uniref:glutathione S-transferase family protein n=1 Tax=Telmatospirillum siberiense TaxID=382514 RepID=UPI0018ECA378|nr:glutathione S-transferase family protein [Telmatospirillum siberiense]